MGESNIKFWMASFLTTNSYLDDCTISLLVCLFKLYLYILSFQTDPCIFIIAKIKYKWNCCLKLNMLVCCFRVDCERQWRLIDVKPLSGKKSAKFKIVLVIPSCFN